MRCLQCIPLPVTSRPDLGHSAGPDVSKPRGLYVALASVNAHVVEYEPLWSNVADTMTIYEHMFECQRGLSRVRYPAIGLRQHRALSEDIRNRRAALPVSHQK